MQRACRHAVLEFDQPSVSLPLHVQSKATEWVACADLSGSYSVELSPGLVSPPGESGKVFLLTSVGIATLMGEASASACCSATDQQPYVNLLSLLVKPSSRVKTKVFRLTSPGIATLMGEASACCSAAEQQKRLY